MQTTGRKIAIRNFFVIARHILTSAGASRYHMEAQERAPLKLHEGGTIVLGDLRRAAMVPSQTIKDK